MPCDKIGKDCNSHFFEITPHNSNWKSFSNRKIGSSFYSSTSECITSGIFFSVHTMSKKIMITRYFVEKKRMYLVDNFTWQGLMLGLWGWTARKPGLVFPFHHCLLWVVPGNTITSSKVIPPFTLIWQTLWAISDDKTYMRLANTAKR